MGVRDSLLGASAAFSVARTASTGVQGLARPRFALRTRVAFKKLAILQVIASQTLWDVLLSLLPVTRPAKVRAARRQIAG